jgi:hypothetical protein
VRSSDRYEDEQMKSILDPSFKYTPSTSTDVRKTFAKVLREERLKAKMKEEQRRVVADIHSLKSKVTR